jgi:hypothetical protein
MALYPYLFPISERTEGDRLKTIEVLKKRLNIEDDNLFKEPLQIHGIFVLYEPLNAEEAIQIICDLCTTKVILKICKNILKANNLFYNERMEKLLRKLH